MNLIFRCDGSLEIGLGHVVRCLALAEELSDNHGCNVIFAMRKSDLGINLVRNRFIVDVPEETNFHYENWLSQCIEKNNLNGLIFDTRDNLDKNIVLRLKQKYNLLIIDIDDPEDKRLTADIVFYPPVKQVVQLDWTGFNGELYSGWEYVIIRKEFLAEYPVPQNEIPNILISMGGSDPSDLTNFVVRALNKIEEHFTATIIIGPGYTFQKNLTETLTNVNYRYKIIQNPPDFAHIVANSNLGIIPFGQTAYEFAALNIPAIYLCLTEDHEKSAKLFVNEGIGISLGKLAANHEQKLIETVLIHIHEKHILKEMSERARLIKISNLNQIASLILAKYHHE